MSSAVVRFDRYIRDTTRVLQSKGSGSLIRLQDFFVFAMERGLKIHKMDDWKKYRVEMYGRLITGGQNGGLDERKIAYRVQDNPAGIYETPKSYSDGVAYNDGSWLIYNTSRIIKKGDKALYKDKVFCRDKSQVIDDLYSYALFLRKIGIEVVYEMNYYAVAFLTKYLRFYDGVFDCTMDNKKKVGEICRSAINKELEEIDCETRIDTRKFALDPDMVKRLKKGKPKKHAIGDTTRFQKKTQKQRTDDLIKTWYDPNLSRRGNIKVFRANGIEDVSLGRLQQWITENVNK